VIYDFDQIPIKPVSYEETDYFKVYRDFLNDRGKYLKQNPESRIQNPGEGHGSEKKR
jgi:hypothetical protein